ncbi:hypothetical protein [Haloferula sp.]|uniref:hypothetical protein n=1 Tax=Haloferula sp. TaxID=2497595 RepID=UPI00329E23A8
MDRTVSDRMEDEEKAGWFHCGRCGAFFGAEVGAGVPESCPECGRDPVIDQAEMAFLQASESSEKKGSSWVNLNQGEGGSRSESGSKRKKKERSGIVVFGAIWGLILVLLAGAVKYFRGSDVEDEQLGFNIISEDQRLLADQIYECEGKVAGFLRAGSPESRAEFVMHPSKTLGRMTSHQHGSAYFDDESALERSAYKVIETPVGKAIETVWKVDDGRRIEAVFFADENGKWKIDWANMVQYSEGDWSLFLVGDGNDESEFRLFARRRSEDHSGKGKVGSIVLVGPRPGLPGELGVSSPEVKVNPDSRIGRVLSKAFSERDAGKGAYGSEASSLDPKGMIRLRVRVKREGEGELAIVIREILACHWYDFDDLGLDD